MYYFNKSQPSKKVTLYSLDYIKSKSKSKSKPTSKPSINTRPNNTRLTNTRPNNTRPRPRTTNMSLFNVKRNPDNNRRGMFRFNSKMKVSAPIY